MRTTALIAGASGLVGGRLLELLLASPDYERVATLGRRPLPLSHPKLEQKTVDFAALDAAAIRGDELFCCLGTTIKKAGGREAFRRVDFDAVLALATLAAQNGVHHFFLVSSMGADEHSAAFYSRVKGEIEKAVTTLPFEGVHIFRPSLLLGARSESRPAEALAQALSPLLSPLCVGPLRPYRPIEAETVARAMLAAARVARPGLEILPSDRIAGLGR